MHFSGKNAKLPKLFMKKVSVVMWCHCIVVATLSQLTSHNTKKSKHEEISNLHNCEKCERQNFYWYWKLHCIVENGFQIAKNVFLFNGHILLFCV